MAGEAKKGAPAWMVSFGDMMTLILTFFILMVSLSSERQVGLVAKGVGSFIVAMRSFGLNGVMDESERLTIFRQVRVRFNLPEEDDPERREDFVDASNLELVRAKAAKALAPHDELNQPGIAGFEPDSAELTESAREYLDLFAPTLRPGRGQTLILEGHAVDAAERFEGDDHWLAYERAAAVRRYLVEEHRFPAERVEARAWVEEIESVGIGTRSVDARLITPAGEDD